MHVEAVNYLAGLEVLTIVIANIDMLDAGFYDSSCEVTKCTLNDAFDREQ